MKQNRLHFFWPLLLVAVLGMPLTLTSCGGDDDEIQEAVDDTPSERQHYYDTGTFLFFKQYGAGLFGSIWNQPWTGIVWSNSGCIFNVYFVQDGKFYNAGSVSSNEKELTEEERNSKNLTFDVEVPSNIDRTRNRGLISFTPIIESRLTDNLIVCNADLKRDNQVYIWDYCYINSGNEKPNNRVNACSYSLLTIEGLYVYNLTNDTISYVHKGFDCAEKWYYTKGNVSVTPDFRAEPQGTSTSGEVFSDTRKVAPGEWGYMTSKYIPTGNKMTDARLVLDINGREYKTDPISSLVDIEYGKYYAMAVKWDGQKLEWLLNEEQLEPPEVPAEAVDLALPSGTKWASCNVGATKPEEVGGYYAWGETIEKNEYVWSNYSLCSGTEGTSNNIGENISGTIYDVAHMQWGGKWCMPTLEEWQEVIYNCTVEESLVNGVKGIWLTSRKNQNRIFIPFSGCRWDTGTYYTDNVYCWLSDLSSTSIDFAKYLIYSSRMGIGNGQDIERFSGMPVRPVMKN